ncbi:MAG: hypothetical protein P1V51_21240 [Deltaproteobacteria bacterium]|nr:hypothetical protein [Deltaproteobacteria bacterium]
MVQPSEAVTLVYGIIALVTLAWVIRGLELPGLRWMVAGVALIGLAYVFTIVEGFVWHALFDTLEHNCYALAGVAFLVGTLRLVRSSVREERPRR